MPRRLLIVLVTAAVACAGDPVPPLADMSVRDMAFPSGCSNGFTDGDETDQDCGGPACMPCDTAKGCLAARDCSSGICINKACAAPGCGDMVKNGNESDTDCGGSCPTTCAEGQKCNDGPDCASLTCVNGICGKSPCTNAMKDGMETDVDCGGATCPKCGDGKMCSDGTDCAGEMCVNNMCRSNCPMGMGDCDGNAGNGCETDLNGDPSHCGACQRACPIGGSCDAGRCMARFAFKLSQMIDGREVRCSAVENKAQYTECQELTAGGRYLHQSQNCEKTWASRFNGNDIAAFCQALTGTAKGEGFLNCGPNASRVEWQNHVWMETPTRPGFVQHVRCYYQ